MIREHGFYTAGEGIWLISRYLSYPRPRHVAVPRSVSTEIGPTCGQFQVKIAALAGLLLVWGWVCVPLHGSSFG